MVKISKTYTPKEKEKYMCAKHLEYFKRKLLDWKKDLKRSNNEAIYKFVVINQDESQIITGDAKVSVTS